MLHSAVPIEAQRRLVDEIMALMGFDREGWRLDDTVHPFATSFGARRRADHHPLGRGLLSDLAVRGDARDAGTGSTRPGSARTCSAARSGTSTRWACTSPRAGCGRTWSAGAAASAPCSRRGLRSCSAHEFAGLDPETLFRVVNRVSPSLIRIEADEATYGLHIVLRFELEQELLDGRAVGRRPAGGVERADA